LWRVVCEINYGGKDYVVTPKVRWSDASQGESAFWKQEKAQRFIAERISPTGECKVRVNPNNPVDSELVALRAQRKFRGFVRAENQSPP
jgi:hypothetical protein